VILVLVSLFILGCATADGFRDKVNRWVGVDAQELVNAWGDPARQFTDRSGNTVYEYTKGLSSRNPMYVSPGPATNFLVVGGGPANFVCVVQFEIKDQRVVGANWRGNACKA
jgi:hypothetical protein